MVSSCYVHKSLFLFVADRSDWQRFYLASHEMLRWNELLGQSPKDAAERMAHLVESGSELAKICAAATLRTKVASL